MTYIMVDVEADGPCPGLYSMIEFAAINCDNPENYFSAKIIPVTENYHEAALKAIGVTRQRTLDYGGDPGYVMNMFCDWLEKIKTPMFISDNNGFDWQFINFYLWKYTGSNPFGHSSTNLNSLYKGYVKNVKKNCKHLRKTKHTHEALDDAMGNVEAFNAFRKILNA
jgi:hypothetical protein